MATVDYLLSCVNSLGVMALLGLAYGVLIRQQWNSRLTNAVLGTLFGIGALIAMVQPIHISEGVLFDLRGLFTGFSGAFLGPIGAALTLLIAIGARIMIGGMIEAGIASIVVPSVMGLAWAYAQRHREHIGLPRLMLLGLLISFGLLGALLLPEPARLVLWTESAPFLVLFNLVGATVFGSFLERERDLSRHEAQLFNEAGTDALTGLLNRRSLFSRFRRMESEAGRTEPPKGTAVLLIDLDHFKAVNDSFGHAIGDRVLQSVADALKRAVRTGDLVARVGGEEFVVVLTDTDMQAAWRTAERIRLEVENASVADDLPELHITTSVGGHWETGLPALNSGLKLADAALYRAKASGRNTVQFSEAALAA
jgi:diguanylate cyclase